MRKLGKPLKRSMKNTLSLLLCVMLLASAVSCGGSSTQTETGDDTAETESATQESTETETTEPDRLDELGAHDYSGSVYTVLDADPSPELHTNIPAEEQTGEMVNDALWTRDAVMEERYNLTIDYVEKTNDGADAVRSSVLANDHAYNLVIGTAGGDLAGLALDGSLANLLDLPQLSLDQKWWSSLMYDSLRFHDAMYITSGDITPTMYQIAACTFVNTDLAEKYNIDCDFVEAVRSGTWTWDLVGTLAEGITQDLNGDGQWAYMDDMFGNIGCFSSYLIPGCAVDICTVSDDGKTLTLTAMNERTVNVCEKLQKVFYPNNPIMRESNDFTKSAFKEDRALFLTHTTESAAVHLRDMESDYLILPVAKYDEAQSGYRSAVNVWATAYISVPSTAVDEMTGVVTEALAYWSYKNMRPLAFDLTYKAKTVRDERSIEMLDVVFDNLYCSFAELYDFGGISSVFWDVLSEGGEIASAVEKVTTKAETEIASFTEKWGAQ